MDGEIANAAVNFVPEIFMKTKLNTLVLASLIVSLAALSRADDAKTIAAALQPFVDGHSLAGAVTLVASKDKVLDVSAVGYADIAAKKPMQPDSMFWIASMSKAMTAAGLMILVDEGKVTVDDPVEKYLPEFRGQMVVAEQTNDQVVLKKPAHPITVKNVLTHTSGLPFMSRAEHKIDQYPLAVAVLTDAMTPLNFQPDTKYQYSNAGINTAGRIIEVVSGMPYEKFMDERLLKPLGMNDTTFWPNEEQLKRLAKAYKPNATKTDLDETDISQCTYPLTNRTRGPSPAGGYFATAADVSRFCRMLLNGGELDGKRILSEAAVKQMTTKQTSDQVQNAYGFGLNGAKNPGDAFGHGGAFSTDMNIDPRRGLVTIFMVQHAGFPNDGSRACGTFRTTAFQLFAK